MENSLPLCPVCKQPWPNHERITEGERTFCRICGTLLELLRKNPPHVIKIYRQAADFGI